MHRLISRLIIAAALLAVFHAAHAAEGPSLRDNADAIHDCAYSAAPASDACLATLNEKIRIIERMAEQSPEFCARNPAQCAMYRDNIAERLVIAKRKGYFRDYADIIAARGFTEAAATVRARGKQ